MSWLAAYRSRRAEGLCTRCGVEPAAPCNILCLACRATKTRQEAERRRRRRLGLPSPGREADRASARAARLRAIELETDDLAVLEHRREVAALGPDDPDAPWASSPAAREAVARWPAALTLEDLAIMWGVSRARVRQIEAQAKAKITDRRAYERRLFVAIVDLERAMERDADQGELRQLYAAAEAALGHLEAVDAILEAAGLDPDLIPMEVRHVEE